MSDLTSKGGILKCHKSQGNGKSSLTFKHLWTYRHSLLKPYSSFNQLKIQGEFMEVGGHYESEWCSATLKKFKQVGEGCTQHVHRTAQVHTDFFLPGNGRVHAKPLLQLRPITRQEELNNKPN